jgi:nitroreductase
MTFIENLKWRRAVKHFSNNDVITNDHISKIMQSIIDSPSSYGLQPYHVIIIQSQELKRRLRDVSYNQPQVEECHTLFIFCIRTDIEQRIEAFIEESDASEEEIQFINEFANSHDQELLNIWASRQLYIALGFALAAATEMKLPSCPMEGFNATKVSKLLKLPEHFQPVTYLAVGGPSEKEHPYPRFRFKKKDLFSKYVK